MARQHTSGQRVSWTGTDFGTGAAVTLACWVRRAAGEGGWLFATEQTPAASAAYLGLYLDPAAGFVRAQHDNQPGLSNASLAQSPDGVATAGVWHHLCGRFDVAARSIWVDGIQQGTNGASEGNAWPGFELIETGRLNTNGANATGRVAECGLWLTLLADAEVVALAKGVPPNRVRPGALALHWPLWGVASPEPDLSGNGRHGTVTGATAADHAPVGR